MRITLLLVAVCALTLNLSANIEEKIESAQGKLNSKKTLQLKLSNKLQKVADDIKKHQKKIETLSRQIEKVKVDINNLKKQKSLKSSELKNLQTIYKKLVEKEKVIGDKVVDSISKELSIEIITGKLDSKKLKHNDISQEDIVMNDILKTYVDLLRKNFRKTKSKYIKYNKNIDLVKSQIVRYAQKENRLKDKQKVLYALQNTQKSSIKALQKQKKAYLEKLNRIKSEQNSLASTLNKLNITKIKLEKSRIKVTSKGVNVRQIGSSYQHGKLIKYRGAKTIPPLKGYSIVQDFGTYIDPIYKIKIFNDGLILRSKHKNAKVYNVLDGTVVYAQKTAMMGGMVIIKHKGNMHTIYAHLSKIAPNVKVSKRLKKGYVIGRVEKELTFKATIDGKLINPTRLIK